MPIRVRLALLFTAAVLVLLVGVGVMFVSRLESGLNGSLDATLLARASGMLAMDAGQGTQGYGGEPLVLGGGYGQVLTTAGVVLRSTPNAAAAPLLSPTQAAAAGHGELIVDTTVTAVGQSAADTEQQSIRLLAMPASRPDVVLAVGGDRDIVDDAVRQATIQLLILGAVVLLLSGPGAWLLAGAALRPVERMRSQAADLQATDAEIGLAVPRSRDEIARLAVTLNGMLGRLHRALVREREFVADAGHELRTPLTVLKGELELAARPGRSRQELLSTIRVATAETDRLVRLAEDLLFLARDDGAATVHAQQVDLPPILGAAIIAASSAAERKAVRLALTAPPTLTVSCDPDRIRRAVDNLLSNALRAAPPSGVIGVELTATIDTVTITVSDDGPGFPAEFLAVAFERFSQADTARTRAGVDEADDVGSGLGLAIVRAIMVQHDGTAVARNRADGPGAQVALTWPRHG